MKNKTIFVACDTSNLKIIDKILSETKTNKLKIIPKFGLQFFYSKQGRKFLEEINCDFWLDLKINDIPQTAISALDSLKDLKKCRYITVHANGGLEMLKAVKKKAKNINKNIKILKLKKLIFFIELIPFFLGGTKLYFNKNIAILCDISSGNLSKIDKKNFSNIIHLLSFN